MIFRGRIYLVDYFGILVISFHHLNKTPLKPKVGAMLCLKNTQFAAIVLPFLFNWNTIAIMRKLHKNTVPALNKKTFFDGGE